jgi:branched-chain amino acid transport system permease protein
MLTILFDGIAYGMLLFILAVGLAVTMGLMNFINLAHGAFAMAGGYITVLLMQRLGVPFLVCLPIAFAGAALLGGVLERTLYRPLYRKPHLDQVLFSIGLTFMAVAATDYFMGSTQQIIQLPEWLRGRTELGQRRLDARDGALPPLHHRRLRSAHRRPAVRAGAHALRQPPARFGRTTSASRPGSVSTSTGVPLHLRLRLRPGRPGRRAGRRGAGAGPDFPLKFMIYFLIVVAVGGTSSITGPLLAALLLGIADVAGKYYIPKMGAFIVYSLMIVILLWRPQRLFVRQGARHDTRSRACCGQPHEGRGSRCCGCCFAAPLLLPSHALIVNEIAIVALFAVSLDLVLGYGGIVSLGHAAFFGMGAYTAALFCKHVMPDPHVGLAGGDGDGRVLGLVPAHRPARHRPDAADGDAGRRR